MTAKEIKQKYGSFENYAKHIYDEHRITENVISEVEHSKELTRQLKNFNNHKIDTDDIKLMLDETKDL